MVNNKVILDACCGSRMFWFDKNNPNVIFQDIRSDEYILCDGSPLHIKPDHIGDFTKMTFPDNNFRLVVFDPPHLIKLSQNTWMAQKYGTLFPTWEQDIKEGFEECMRVLMPYGILIFKWNEAQVTINQVLKAIGKTPLFGHVTGKHGRTIWCAFMKFPEVEPVSEWYCPQCDALLCNEQVTFEETHSTCGTPVQIKPVIQEEGCPYCSEINCTKNHKYDLPEVK